MPFVTASTAAQQHAEEALRRSEEKYRLLFESAQDGILILDAGTGRITEVNPYLADLLGFTREELAGKHFRDIGLAENAPAHLAALQELHAKKHARYEHLPFRTAGGRTIDVELVCNEHRIDGTTIIQCNVRDVTERKRIEDQIRYLSFHDKVTGLYNRTYFEEELARLDTGRELPMSLIMGDVNNLKVINDAFGHRMGDEMLRKTAEIVKSCCRNEDIAARYGGDEFVVFLPKTKHSTALSIARRIREFCAVTQTGPLKPSIALGTATRTKGTCPIADLLKDAEDKMYRNKLWESKRIISGAIISLLKILEARDPGNRAHSMRLCRHAAKMGALLKLPKENVRSLILLAVLHDIGKAALPKELLMKPDKLSAAEWQLMARHVEIGYRIARSFGVTAPIAGGILSQHERWDGAGYPQKLRETRIPLQGRILAVTAAYDVMTHPCPYKRTRSVAEAKRELKDKAGTQFDPGLVKLFISSIEREGTYET